MPLSSRLLTKNSSDYFHHTGVGIQLLLIETKLCQAVVSLQGAQILSFKPKGQPEMLWLSPENSYQPGKRIWGGIPICAPWFGRHQDPALPIHGFVQNRLWQLHQHSENELGEVSLTFAYASDSQDLALFPQAFRLELNITLGTCLKMALKTTNFDVSPMDFSWAFHSFLAVDNLNNTQVSGLANQAYLDAALDMSKQYQTGPVAFDSQVDRVFQASPDHLLLSGSTALQIEANNSPTSILWNPGQALARQMPELGPQGYKDFVCIERGAAFSDTWSLTNEQSLQGEQRLSYVKTNR